MDPLSIFVSFAAGATFSSVIPLLLEYLKSRSTQEGLSELIERFVLRNPPDLEAAKKSLDAGSYFASVALALSFLEKALLASVPEEDRRKPIPEIAKYLENRAKLEVPLASEVAELWKIRNSIAHARGESALDVETASRILKKVEELASMMPTGKVEVPQASNPGA